MQIAIELEPSEKDSRRLSEGIISFNHARIPDLESIKDEKRFSIFARDMDGEIQGGLRATCYWNTLHIELLWIAAEARSRGLGREIIECAEIYALENRCSKAFVETTSWQAKPFYEKHGYKLIATLNDRPKGHASHYLAKSLLKN